ncbi:MAG: asparaginase [Kiloniellaceae bacterium]
MNLPTVAVFSLGGTIAMSRGGGEGVVPALTGEVLVAAVPELAVLARIRVTSFRSLPGAQLSFDDLIGLAGEIRRCLTEGCAGVVVTQGTDTLEETAFALDLMVEGDAPIVVTGAMRNPTLPGSDGPANLLAAVAVARSEAARGLGTLVVMNDEIHAARFVQKTHTASPAAFASGASGVLGWLAEGSPRIVLRPPRGPRLTPSAEASETAVALLTTVLGDDGRLIASAAAGYAGLVVEALGGGHVPQAAADALEAAARRIPVVFASRTGRGEVLARTYGFPGSEIDLQRRGLIRAGWLDGPKARVLLTLLLRTEHDVPGIRRQFEAFGGG